MDCGKEVHSSKLGLASSQIVCSHYNWNLVFAFAPSFQLQWFAWAWVQILRRSRSLSSCFVLSFQAHRHFGSSISSMPETVMLSFSIILSSGIIPITACISAISGGDPCCCPFVQLLHQRHSRLPLRVHSHPFWQFAFAHQWYWLKLLQLITHKVCLVAHFKGANRIYYVCASDCINIFWMDC